MKKVEKRLPFGWLGLWSKLYQKYNYNQEEEINSEIVEYNKTNYVALKMPIQIKEIGEYEKSKNKILASLTNGEDYKIVETTDCYYDNKEKEYKCIVDIDELLHFKNNYWLTEKIIEKNIFTPRKQSFYYIQLKKISKEKLNVK